MVLTLEKMDVPDKTEAVLMEAAARPLVTQPATLAVIARRTNNVDVDRRTSMVEESLADKCCCRLFSFACLLLLLLLLLLLVDSSPGQ
jgi:hypothetical protein